MNEKTCKRMRRYIQSLGLNPKEPTVYQWLGVTTIPLPYRTLNPSTLLVHPQTFRGQYQKLKKMVKQNRLDAPTRIKKSTWLTLKPDRLTEVLDAVRYLNDTV